MYGKASYDPSGTETSVSFLINMGGFSSTLINFPEPNFQSPILLTGISRCFQPGYHTPSGVVLRKHLFKYFLNI